MSGVSAARAPLVDVVIPSFDDGGPAPDSLQLCLGTVAAFTGVPHRVLLERSRGSAAANRNRALARSTAPYVCFLDDDAWVTPGWCEKLLALLDRRPDIGMAGPKIKLESGQIFCFGIDHRPPATFLPVGYGDTDGGAYDGVWEPFALPATCLLVRRAALAAAGGFEDGYRSCQWEDLDFYLRLRAHGWRGLATGEVAVYHRHLFRSASYESNSDLFFQIWGAALGLAPAAPAAAAAGTDPTVAFVAAPALAAAAAGTDPTVAFVAAPALAAAAEEAAPTVATVAAPAPAPPAPSAGVPRAAASPAGGAGR